MEMRIERHQFNAPADVNDAFHRRFLMIGKVAIRLFRNPSEDVGAPRHPCPERLIAIAAIRLRPILNHAGKDIRPCSAS